MAKAKMPIPWDWDGESWKCWAIEWPDSPLWRAILEGFVTTPMKGRFWDERTGTVTDAQLIGIEIDHRNNPSEEVLMTCGSEAAAALLEIANALTLMANKQCCGEGIPGASGGTGGGGMVPQEPNGTNTGEEAREGPPPDGFDSWEEYDTYRCNMAAYIINEIKADVAKMSIATIAGLSATEAAGVLILLLTTPAGWVVILTLAALAIQATIIGLAYSFLITIIEENYDEFVCSLLSGDDVTNAISSYAAKVDELVTASGYYPDAVTNYLAVNILTSLGTVDSFNRLFAKVPYTLDDYDCNCGGETAPYTVADGNELTDNPSNPIEIEAVLVSGCYVADIQWDVPVTVTNAVVLAGDPFDCLGNYIYNYWDLPAYGGVMYGTNSRPQDDVIVQDGTRGMRMVFSSATTIQVTYTVD